MGLKIGAKAPDFELTDRSGTPFRLSSALKACEFAIVYFYPKDDTPGCTIEALEFSRDLPLFKERGVRVFGISGGDDNSKAKFCSKHGLSVTLLSDSDFSIAKSYEAFGKKSFMGRTFNGVFRKTFVIDNNQRIVLIFDTVKAEGHSQEILNTVDRLRSPDSPVLNPVTKPARAKTISAKSLPTKRTTRTVTGKKIARVVKADRKTVKKAIPTKKAKKVRKPQRKGK